MEGSLYKQLFDLTQMALGNADDNQNLENMFNNIKEAFKELEELRAYKQRVRKSLFKAIDNERNGCLVDANLTLAIMGDEVDA